MKQEMLLEKTALPAVLWLPEGSCRLVVQIAHGMTEHMGRYENLARVLTEEGIAVAGFDLPGHGCHAPATRCASLGENGWQQAMEQLEALHGALENGCPEGNRCCWAFPWAPSWCGMPSGPGNAGRTG